MAALRLSELWRTQQWSHEQRLPQRWELRLQQQLAAAQAEQRAERDHAEQRLTAMQGEKSASREGLQCRLQTGSNVPTHVACVQASIPLTWQLQMQDKAASMTIMCSSWPVRKADTGI